MGNARAENTGELHSAGNTDKRTCKTIQDESNQENCWKNCWFDQLPSSNPKRNRMNISRNMF